MSKLSSHDSTYKFSDKDGVTVVVDVEHGSDFYRAANKLTDTVRDIPLTRLQRQKMLKQILDLVQVCESDAIMQTLLDYPTIMEQVE